MQKFMTLKYFYLGRVKKGRSREKNKQIKTTAITTKKKGNKLNINNYSV